MVRVTFFLPTTLNSFWGFSIVEVPVPAKSQLKVVTAPAGLVPVKLKEVLLKLQAGPQVKSAFGAAFKLMVLTMESTQPNSETVFILTCLGSALEYWWIGLATVET